MSHLLESIVLGRIDRELKEISSRIFGESVPLSAEVAVTPEPVPFMNRLSLDYRPVKVGDHWGEAWDCAWFHVTGTLPKSWKGKYAVPRIDLGGEGLVCDNRGRAIQGISNRSVFSPGFSRQLIHGLFDPCRGGEKIDFWIEAGANWLGGANWSKEDFHRVVNGKPALDGVYHNANVAALEAVLFDRETWSLEQELVFLKNLVQVLPKTSARRQRVLYVVGKALDVWPVRGTAAARALLAPLLAVPSDPGTVDVTGVGHAHIDIGYRWPVREGYRKAARTFATQLHLLDLDPDYLFGASQPQLYEAVKEHHPDLFARIKKAVAEGRWELQGGMWVEPDCNIPSGESLARQLLLGMNFFRDEFGVEVKNCWIPDVFGYSGALPQILEKAGVRYFLTQKISWNLYTTFPHNTFWWRGIDGKSRVLAHFPPEDSYSSSLKPETFVRHETNNKEAGILGKSVSLYGIGDGGGGPTEDMLLRAELLGHCNGLPRLRPGTAQSALEEMESLALSGSDLATWHGELYVERHRGTYTTHAYLKFLHRRAEEALKATEMLASLDLPSRYPRKALQKLWKTVLQCEFHDILPGSSIHRVYREAHAELENVLAECRAMQAKSAARVLTKKTDAMTLFNPSSTDFSGVVELPYGWEGAEIPGAGLLPSQHENGRTLVRANVGGNRFATLVRAGAGKMSSAPSVSPPARTPLGGWVLENEAVRYEFDARMRLVSALTKENGREWVPAGAPGNRLELFEDHTPTYDAWDVEEYFVNVKLAEPEILSVEPAGHGAVRTGLRVRMRIAENEAEQTVWLENGSIRLDFVTDIDWKSREKILRVAFPTTVYTDMATYEIQYGEIRRPTRRNTLEEHAKFEVSGHRYADLSGPDGGVALLNDCKYGYRADGNELSLSLLRGTGYPDPVADLGRHRFTYSFLPHFSGSGLEKVREEAAALNQGVLSFPGLAAPETGFPGGVPDGLPVSFSGCGAPGYEISAIKRAEKNDDLIVRVYEPHGRTVHGEITPKNRDVSIRESDIPEWRDLSEPRAGILPFELGPYEIKTFRVSRG